jgi:hypothetical protein
MLSDPFRESVHWERQINFFKIDFALEFILSLQGVQGKCFSEGGFGLFSSFLFLSLVCDVSPLVFLGSSSPIGNSIERFELMITLIDSGRECFGLWGKKDAK